MFDDVQKMQHTLNELTRNLEKQMRDHLVRETVEDAVDAFRVIITKDVEARVSKLTVDLVKGYFNTVKCQPEVLVRINDSIGC